MGKEGEWKASPSRGDRKLSRRSQALTARVVFGATQGHANRFTLCSLTAPRSPLPGAHALGYLMLPALRAEPIRDTSRTVTNTAAESRQEAHPCSASWKCAEDTTPQCGSN